MELELPQTKGVDNYSTPMSRPLTPALSDLSLTQIINAGKTHLSQFYRLGTVEDANKAVKYLSIALDSMPEDHQHLVTVLHALSLSYSDRFERLGDVEDLNRAIECEVRLLASTPDNHPDFTMRLQNLGASYGMRFQRLLQPGDLDKAIEYASKAISRTPDGHPDMMSLLNNLGVLYAERYKRLGQLNDIGKAIVCQSRSVALARIDYDEKLPNWLHNLAASYQQRFNRTGEPRDIQKMIECLSSAISLTPENHSHLPYWLTSLGMAYTERFRRLGDLGDLGDLEKSIKYKVLSVTSTPEDHVDLPYRLSSLGMGYSDRFERLGEIADLERAIEHKSRSVSFTPDGHPDLPTRLTSLGLSLNDRFKHCGNIADLEEAIRCYTNALSLTPNDHPEFPSRHMNLGAQYTVRYRRLQDMGSLEKAIEFSSLALSLAPDDYLYLPFIHSNLGDCLSLRFGCLRNLDDLSQAITHASYAVALVPANHPTSSVRHRGLAIIQVAHFESTGDLSSLQHSLQSYRNASQSLVGSPRTRFSAALEWSKFASIYGLMNPIEAYQTAIDLLPQFIWLGATTNQRYYDLDKAKDLAICAAAAAIQSSEYMLAVEWLEHARCVVWNQSLMLRSPLDELRSSHPTIADRLQTVASQLRNAGSESRASREMPADVISSEQAAQEHRGLAQEYSDLLSKVRQLAGFEDFLRPIKGASLLKAARNGPVVVINCHTSRCDALLIQPGQDRVIHIPLPYFTLEKAQRVRSEIEATVRSKQVRERGERRPIMDLESKDGLGSMLATLWYDIVKPVLDYLAYTTYTTTGSLPHITWCPTGAVSFLPLHAAGDYDRPGSSVFDYVISSYTPTLSALLASTPSTLSRGSRVLAIGQEDTPGHARLPGTTQELAYVQAHMPDRARYTQLMNNQATTTAVLDAMEQHEWVHLACHAHQNVTDATQSGFFLHDGTLDLAAINRRSFKNKGLAFLSACQTATGDEKLPDEAVHLASGMLMAGYTSVIATMWSVHDEDAPAVADRVYAQLMKDGKIGSGEAGKALHNAVTDLREKVGVKAFGRWVPYIHIGS